MQKEQALAGRDNSKPVRGWFTRKLFIYGGTAAFLWLIWEFKEEIVELARETVRQGLKGSCQSFWYLIRDNPTYSVPVTSAFTSSAVYAFGGFFSDSRRFGFERDHKHDVELKEDMEGYFVHGIKALEIKDYAEATESFRKAGEHYEMFFRLDGRSMVKTKRIHAMFNQAKSLFLMRQFKSDDQHPDGALDVVNELLKLDASCIDALNLRGIIYFRLDEYKKAEVDFLTSLENDRTQISILLSLLFVRAELKGDTSEQKKLYSIILQHDLTLLPKHDLITVEIFEIYAKAALAMNAHEKALSALLPLLQPSTESLIYKSERLKHLMLGKTVIEKIVGSLSEESQLTTIINLVDNKEDNFKKSDFTSMMKKMETEIDMLNETLKYVPSLKYLST